MQSDRPVLVNFDILLEKVKALTPNGVLELSARSGVPVATILKIRGGHTREPRMPTVQRLINALR